MRAIRATVLGGVSGCEWGRFVGRLGCWLVWVWLLGVLELYNDLVTIWCLGLCLGCGCEMIFMCLLGGILQIGLVVEYLMSVSFQTSKELTADEISCLVGSVELQLQEPQDFDNEDALWNASHYSVRVGLVK